MNISKFKRLQKMKSRVVLEDGEYDYKVVNVKVDSNVATNNGIATNRVTIDFELSKDNQIVDNCWSLRYDSFLKEESKSQRFYYFLNMVEKSFKNTVMYNKLFPSKGEINPQVLENTTGTLNIQNKNYNGTNYRNLCGIFPDVALDGDCLILNNLEDIFNDDDDDDLEIKW
jgi:hypothetical protein